MTLTGQRILIVADDLELVQPLHEALERGGYRVLVAQDGENPLHILRRELPDLALMDLALPAGDGLDGTDAVRGGMSLAAMPLIRLDVPQDGKELGAWDLGTGESLTEPLNPDEIVAWVRTALHRVQGKP
ncbi:MAG: response regulator, partial [Anaerolineae bacterium]